MSKRLAYIAAVVGVICVAFFIRAFLFAQQRTVRSDILQGALIGFGLAFVTAQVYARMRATNVNGWITMKRLSEPGNGFLLRAAQAQLFPGPVNTPDEATYWWTNADGAGHALTGERSYRMQFPPGQLPPTGAFWSITMGDARNRFVANPIDRYSVSERSGLIANPDGSVDIYIQHAPPVGHEANWLPAPTGNFILWLRAYMPGRAILDGTYVVPPVVQTP